MIRIEANLSAMDMEEMFAEVDTDGDGHVNFEGKNKNAIVTSQSKYVNISCVKV